MSEQAIQNPAETAAVQGPLTARQTVEQAQATADSEGGYDYMYDPNYNDALDAITDEEHKQVFDARTNPAMRDINEYTPSASIGKPLEQIQGVQRAVNNQLIAEGKEPYYALFPVDTKK